MENQNTENTPGTAPDQQQGKTFTQEQVNAIVGKRLAEQKATLEAELVKREQEIKKREMGVRANELLAEKGLPKGLAAVLWCDTEEELVKAVSTIEHVMGSENKNKARGGFRKGR